MSHLHQGGISKKHQEQIFSIIEKKIEGADLLVFSDFNYGCLPQSLVEKLTELGIQDIYPIRSARSQLQSIDIDRLQSKALSAMKQCKRSILPRIHPLQTISDIELLINNYQILILGDVKGLTAIPVSQQKHISILICIGPEGGFSDEEQEILRSFPQTLPIRLGHSRLRAETAAIALTSIAAFHYS